MGKKKVVVNGHTYVLKKKRKKKNKKKAQKRIEEIDKQIETLKGEKSKLKVFPTIKEHLRIIFKNLFNRSMVK